MTLSTTACLAAVSRHSAGFAAAARGNFGAPVEHCPAWSVADLVWHLSEVHWFWATIAEERSSAPPDAVRRPTRPPEDALVEGFEAGAVRLMEVLATADPGAPCWTWSPHHQNVGFIVRHQVQEAAVHHWDAAHAAGLHAAIEPAVAVDAIDEFLDVSVTGTLDGPLVLRATDTADAWTVGAPDPPPATAGGLAGPVLAASAADLLLWLYGRVHLDTASVAADRVAAFRALVDTE